MILVAPLPPLPRLGLGKKSGSATFVFLLRIPAVRSYFFLEMHYFCKAVRDIIRIRSKRTTRGVCTVVASGDITREDRNQDPITNTRNYILRYFHEANLVLITAGYNVGDDLEAFARRGEVGARGFSGRVKAWVWC